VCIVLLRIPDLPSAINSTADLQPISRAEIVAVHCDSETGLKSLDVSYEPRVPGGPFEFEPSVEVDRCSDFEIADSRPDVDTCFLKPEDFDLERVSVYGFFGGGLQIMKRLSYLCSLFLFLASDRNVFAISNR
jgi:hypothetical protein